MGEGDDHQEEGGDCDHLDCHPLDDADVSAEKCISITTTALN